MEDVEQKLENQCREISIISRNESDNATEIIERLNVKNGFDVFQCE
jgi:hypothetical protein